MKRALALVLFFAGACATGSHLRNVLQELQESVDAYNEAYRWKNYERAASFLPPDLRAAFLSSYEDSDNALHVEDYQVLKVNLENDNAATVTLRYRYMQLPSVNVERKTLVQHWHRLEGVWILETEDNSIRDIDKAAKASEKAEGASPDNEKEKENGGDTQVKVTGPSGQVIRSEGDFGDEEKSPPK